MHPGDKDEGKKDHGGGVIMLQWKIWGAWITAIIHKGREDGYCEWASINPNIIGKLESLDSPCHSLPASNPPKLQLFERVQPGKTANAPNENSNDFSRGILTRGVTLILRHPGRDEEITANLCVKMGALSFHRRARRLPIGSGRGIEREYFIIKGTFYQGPELGCEGWEREEMVEAVWDGFRGSWDMWDAFKEHCKGGTRGRRRQPCNPDFKFQRHPLQLKKLQCVNWINVLRNVLQTVMKT